MKMSTELANIDTKTGLPSNITGMATALRRSADTVSAGGNKPFLKFTKFGEWMYGTDNVEIEPTEEWAVNVARAACGWVGWGDKAHGTEGQPMGEEFAYVMAGEQMKTEDELPEIDGQWAQAISLEFKEVDGSTELLWKASSKGAKDSYAALMVKVAEKLEEEDPYFFPVVTMSRSSYQHDKYGKIFTPVLDVVRWVNINGEASATKRKRS